MTGFEDIRKNEEINTYIQKSNDVLGAIGYTEHGFAHCKRTADISARILRKLGYDERTCELAQIAGYMHDIGNMVNRVAHAQSSALITFDILQRLGFTPEENATWLMQLRIISRIIIFIIGLYVSVQEMSLPKTKTSGYIQSIPHKHSICNSNAEQQVNVFN
ncbi:MAG: HD domain-containing protein, partial [Eubacteriales bacterium]